MPEYKITEVTAIDKAFNWADPLITKALTTGEPVVLELRREKRNNDQNSKLWAMLSDFTSSNIELSGRNNWQPEQWKCFIMSAFNQEMPAVGLMGEPVSVSTSTSKMNKRRFCELIEFIYATGTERGVKWSEPAIRVYEEYKEISDNAPWA